MVASPEMVQELKTALQDGQTQSEAILKERVFTKIKTLTSTIHRNKRKNFTSESVVVSSGTSMTVAHMEKSRLAAFLNHADGSDIIKLETALAGRVTEECLAMYNVNGSFRKTCKSKLLYMFNKDPITEKLRNHISLVDIRLIWRFATPTPEDREATKRDSFQ